MYHFSESPRFVGIDRLLYPWPRAINCLVHWSSSVRKLVFSQQYGPVRRSSTVRKLVATLVLVEKARSDEAALNRLYSVVIEL